MEIYININGKRIKATAVQNNTGPNRNNFTIETAIEGPLTLQEVQALHGVVGSLLNHFPGAFELCM